MDHPARPTCGTGCRRRPIYNDPRPPHRTGWPGSPTYRRSSRQAVLVIERVAVVGGPKRLLHVPGAVLADGLHAGDLAVPVGLGLQIAQPAGQRRAHGIGDAFPGERRDLAGEAIGLGIVDGQGHGLSPTIVCSTL